MGRRESVQDPPVTLFASPPPSLRPRTSLRDEERTPLHPSRIVLARDMGGRLDDKPSLYFQHTDPLAS